MLMLKDYKERDYYPALLSLSASSFFLFTHHHHRPSSALPYKTPCQQIMYHEICLEEFLYAECRRSNPLASPPVIIFLLLSLFLYASRYLLASLIDFGAAESSTQKCTAVHVSAWAKQGTSPTNPNPFTNTPAQSRKSPSRGYFGTTRGTPHQLWAVLV